MYFKGGMLGVSTFQHYQGFPTTYAYSNIKIYGHNIIDNVHIYNKELTLDEINLLEVNIEPTWGINTLMLSLFNNNLNGGNITGLVNPITNWVIQRKKETESVYKTLSILPVNNSDYIDITAESGVIYNYRVLAINATEISEPLDSQLKSDFFNCMLIDEETQDVYIMNLNLDFSGYDNEVAHQRYDGYNKYSAHSFGNRNFKTGDVSCIINEDVLLNINLNQGIDFLKKFTSFINNGKSKLLKDRKGNVLRVVTTDGVSQAPLHIGIAEQPYIISFHFEESGEV